MRVVIVEGAPSLRDALVRVLTQQGITVAGTAGGLADALREIARTSPDVVVVDAFLPPGQADDGLHTARVIRTEHPEIGLVLLSSETETDPAEGPVSFGPPGVGRVRKEHLGDSEHLLRALRRAHAEAARGA